MSVVIPLVDKKLVTPPRWLVDGIHYETFMGSVAYGVSTESSDIDIYGFCIPPKEILFPHINGVIYGFGPQGERFDQFQQHHVAVPDSNKIYDINIYNIVKYFKLCAECNPNMIDSLYTPESVVVRQTHVAENIRAHSNQFLSKLAWIKFKGYALSQLSKLRNRSPIGKRVELIEKYGFDVKYAYHLIRLLDEADQILTTGTINLQRDAERLIEIKNGAWTLEQVEKVAQEELVRLDNVYTVSKLREVPDMIFLKQLLLDSLEEVYGDLKGCINLDSDSSCN